MYDGKVCHMNTHHFGPFQKQNQPNWEYRNRKTQGWRVAHRCDGSMQPWCKLISPIFGLPLMGRQKFWNVPNFGSHSQNESHYESCNALVFTGSSSPSHLWPHWPCIPLRTLIFMPYDSQGISIIDPVTFSYDSWTTLYVPGKSAYQGMQDL